MDANFASSFLHLDLDDDGVEDGILDAIDSGKAKKGCLRLKRMKLSVRVGIN